MTRLQDDFYDAVNGEWEKTAVIPDDKPRTGGFSDLADEIEDLMLKTTDQWLAGEHLPEDPILANFVKFHQLVADYDQREAVGTKPAQELINEYQALDSFASLLAVLRPMRWTVSPINFHLGYHQTLWMLRPMCCGRKHQDLFCQIRPTMRMAMLRGRSYWPSGVNPKRPCFQNLAYQMRLSKTCSIRY